MLVGLSGSIMMMSRRRWLILPFSSIKLNHQSMEADLFPKFSLGKNLGMSSNAERRSVNGFKIGGVISTFVRRETGRIHVYAEYECAASKIRSGDGRRIE